MRVHNEVLSAIVCISMLYVTNVLGLPHMGRPSPKRTHLFEYHTPEDNWNISSVPRSIEPHLLVMHEAHDVPPRKSNQQIEDELLASLRDVKVFMLPNFIVLSNESGKVNILLSLSFVIMQYNSGKGQT